MVLNTQYASAVVSVSLVGGVCYIIWSVYNKVFTKTLPTVWKEVGTLSSIAIYPIKSGGSIDAMEAECTTMGLRIDWLRDRVLMVVDQKGNFLTARAYPELLLVKPEQNGAILTLTHQDMEPLQVDLAEVKKSPITTAYVWSTAVPVHNCGGEASEWFSRLLLRSSNALRFVYYASDRCRLLRETSLKIFPYTKANTGAFPDETSYNLINDASVVDLQSRMKDSSITAERFRPNFILKGAEPLAEDNWKFVKIGENIFEVIKDCSRCLLTSIDPETGVRNAKAEPLTTLKSYHQIEDPEKRKSAGRSPRMGLQMALRSGPGGRVSVKDVVYVNCE